MRTHKFMINDKILCINTYSNQFKNYKIYQVNKNSNNWPIYLNVSTDDWISSTYKHLYSLSQDEIDQLIKDLNDQYTQNTGYPGLGHGVSSPNMQYDPSIPGYIPIIRNDKDDQLSFGLSGPEAKKECVHEFYQGFHDKVASCTKCNKVKDT